MYTGVLLSVGIMRCDLIYFNLAESMRPDSTIYGKAILSLTLVCLWSLAFFSEDNFSNMGPNVSTEHRNCCSFLSLQACYKTFFFFLRPHPSKQRQWQTWISWQVYLIITKQEWETMTAVYFRKRDRNFSFHLIIFLLAIGNRKLAMSSFPEQCQLHKASNFVELLLNPDIIPSHYTKDINAGIKLQNNIRQINFLPFHLPYLLCSMNGN